MTTNINKTFKVVFIGKSDGWISTPEIVEAKNEKDAVKKARKIVNCRNCETKVSLV